MVVIHLYLPGAKLKAPGLICQLWGYPGLGLSVSLVDVPVACLYQSVEYESEKEMKAAKKADEKVRLYSVTSKIKGALKMNRQMIKRLAVKGTMTYIAVFSLVLMVAMPALALMANSVGTKEIKDHSIRSADIRNKAVTTDRIAPRAVKRGKIGKRAIRTEHVKYLNDSKIRYSTKTKVLTIPGAAFAVADPGPNPAYTIYDSYITTFKRVIAPVYLPDKARVTKIEFHMTDRAAGNKITGSLASATDAQAESGARTPMALAATPGVSTSWEHVSTTAITGAVINNAAKQYFVRVAPDSLGTFKLARAKITYRVSGP